MDGKKAGPHICSSAATMQTHLHAAATTARKVVTAGSAPEA
ncbi:hypothetical protein AXZ77_0895 [Thioclava sp. ES.031]|nr:hypothetical protein AXZ77_0895 [Thioclava sp. ES.031]